jgi:hypothetical protein
VLFAAAFLARQNAFDLLAGLLIAGLLVTVLFTFDDYGISNDEEVQQRYGEMIVAYYASAFADQSLFKFQNLYLYGGLFDLLVVLLGHVIPVDLYIIRHVLCPLIGLAGIVATWATARLVAGPQAGAIAAISLAICGVWYGGMFNHTKDIPFAAAMMGATYFLIRAMRALPRPPLRDIVFFGLLLGAALGQRAMGLLILFYIAVAIGLAALALEGNVRARLLFIVRSGLSFLPACVIGYVMMIAAWPWSALDLFNPLRAILAFSHFQFRIRTLLAGEIYDMATVPRWYVPAYLLIKLPLITFIGAAASALFLLLPRRSSEAAARRAETGLIAFTVAFPLLCHVIAHGPAFTGMRHFLFVVPPLSVLAGIGLNSLLDSLRQRGRVYRLALAGAMAAAMIWDATLLVRLHPDQYLFYNPLVGGLEGAARRYDTDYWVNIMPEAVDNLEAFLGRTEKASQTVAQRYTVAVCGERLPFEKEADPALKWTDDWRRADFFIAPTHMDCDRALEGKTIATIERLGVPIGVVKDRRAITRPDVATAR